MKEEYYTEAALEALRVELLAAIEAMEAAPEKFNLVTIGNLFDISCVCTEFIEVFHNLKENNMELYLKALEQ